jgi:hypothetical protein
MKKKFNNWWDKDLLTEDNPYDEGTPAYWAWEGWSAGVNAEREACAKVCEDFDFKFQDDSAGTLQGAAEAIRARGTHD